MPSQHSSNKIYYSMGLSIVCTWSCFLSISWRHKTEFTSVKFLMSLKKYMKHNYLLYLIDTILFCIKINLQMKFIICLWIMMQFEKLREFKSIIFVNKGATYFIYISKNWDEIMQPTMLSIITEKEKT